MTGLLHAELVKLRTTRTFAMLVADAAAATVLVVVLGAVVRDHATPDSVRTLFAIDPTALFALLLGAVSTAGEWRHRTIAASVLAAPDRLRLLAAKAAVCAWAGAAMSLVVSSLAMLAGTVILSRRGLPTLDAGTLADVLWRNVLNAAAAGAVGVAVGALVRNQAAAIAGLLVVAFIVEPILVDLVPGVGRFGPLVGAPSGVSSLPGQHDLLAPALALAVSLTWAAALFGAAAFRLRRRDLV